MKTRNTLISLLKWTARIWGVLSIAYLLMVFVGGALSDPSPVGFRPHEIVALIFFPIGVATGIIIGYWKGVLGGIITLSSLVLFYIAEYIPTGDLAGGPWFGLIAAPGLLFLIADLVSKRPISPKEA